ncbi:hypothetical protein BSL78_08410 [Apostichopus japonicus]|uniref:Uncharacterized protein n=1 Tax=Stichopus japonicus TaxID=307972 RepID=A0A2G8L344_STIJA|nr:hypothetical protein BSL78_08410 [Apostichopus japonicus]
MLAIIPDYGDSDSENSDDSETEEKGQDGDDSSHVTSKDCPRLDVCLPLEKKGDLSLSKADSNLKKSPERERMDAQSTSSLSPLKPEQASVIRYLALKRRKDEELKVLEEADELERRREIRKERKREVKGQEIYVKGRAHLEVVQIRPME